MRTGGYDARRPRVQALTAIKVVQVGCERLSRKDAARQERDRGWIEITAYDVNTVGWECAWEAIEEGHPVLVMNRGVDGRIDDMNVDLLASKVTNEHQVAIGE